MPAIAMAFIWGGYTLSLWGYTLVKGYQISVADLVVPGRYKGAWPPPPIPAPGDNAPQLAPGTKPVNPPNSHPGDAPWSYAPPIA